MTPLSEPLTIRDAQARATYRRKHSDYGVGAALYRSVGSPGRDGLLLSVIITDTMHGFGEVEVSVAGLDSRERVLSTEEIAALETAVERRAVHRTMQELVGGDVIGLTAEEWEAGSS